MTTWNADKSAAHLRRLINTRNGEVPNFALLLGAGASQTSGVDTAAKLIDEWRQIMISNANADDDHAWLTAQDWYQHEDEYSMLFEMVYDQPAQRRVFIEERVKDAHPTWGYAYLTNLLAHRYFDVAFTTNFDDLVNEACYLYSENLRPIVAAHDSAIQGIRVTSGRPKIIKLHGDFLYDNIKNTLTELETLEDNTKRKLHQFAQEYGLIVIGYSGRDRSVMDTLDVLLRDDDNYKQGIYWCLRHGEDPSRRLQALLRRDRVYLVRIDGFDEFLADLHNDTKKDLPMAIARPFELARERANLFVNVQASLDSHPVIQEHKKELLQSIAQDASSLPNSVLASMLVSTGQIDDAILYWDKAIEQEPENTQLAYRYADALANAERYEQLGKLVKRAAFSPDNATYFYLRAFHNDDVVSLATETLNDQKYGRGNLADDRLSIVIINRAIALKRLNRFEEMEYDLSLLEAKGFTNEDHIRAGVAALRKDRPKMFEAIGRCLFRTIMPWQLLTFPVFEDYQADTEFQRFVASVRHGIVDMRPWQQYDQEAIEEDVMPGPDY